MTIKSRYPEVLGYRAQSVWDGKTGGNAITAERKIFFDTPRVFGGNGKGICPDEMFVGAVLGCLNNTYLDFQRKYELELVSLRLQGMATAEFDKDGYTITGFLVTGDIVVGKDELEIGQRCLELMKTYCHLTRTIKDSIPFEYDINVSEQT
ncbi:MAG: OsmC family protein [Candidatus Thorarchaeota archaeon]|jgi:uncharacterized OsmC-like protein